MPLYSRDFRERLLRAHDAGLSDAEIARNLGASPRTLSRDRALLRRGESLDPKPIPGRPRALSPEHEDLLAAQIAACPDATLAEHRDRLAQDHGVAVSVWTVGRSVRRQGLPLKEKSLIATERKPEQRAAWQERMTDVPAEDLVFLEETSTRITMTQTRDRAPREVRLVGAVPRNHGDKLTLIMAVGVNGVNGLNAPLVFPRAINGDLFSHWVTEWLMPTVRPGQIVVQDNRSVQKDARARTAIKAAGCRLAFPPVYSSDRNPIELGFAPLKRQVRQATARTPDAVIDGIEMGLNRMTPEQRCNCYRHCGYPTTSP